MNLYVADGSNHALRKIVISSAAVTTFAGSAGLAGTTDGIGSTARFFGPQGVARNGADLYVTDSSNNTIRRVSISTAAVTTFAGQAGNSGSTDASNPARFNSSQGITSDGIYLYLLDSAGSMLRRVDLDTGFVKTLAGSNGAYGSTNATGSTARFYWAYDVTYDGANLYIADYMNNTIRKVVPSTGAVTTFAGTAGVSGYADGTGSAATFNHPMGITNDGTNLYVADTDNHTIRQIVISTAAVTTYAGVHGQSGTTDGVGGLARFNTPQGMVKEGDALYLVDTGNNSVRRVDLLTSAATTLAGTSGTHGYLDGTGTAALFKQPQFIASDGTSLYVTEVNHTVRKIVISTGVVTTLAGTGGTSGSVNGTGSGALFSSPVGIAYAGGKLYVSESGNYAIRMIQ
jgi:hypothetical protein